MDKINGEAVERAERTLVSSAQLSILPGPEVLFSRARIEGEAVEQFMRKCRTDLRARKGFDLDPRLEPTIMTELRHALLVGIIAGRQHEKQQ